MPKESTNKSTNNFRRMRNRHNPISPPNSTSNPTSSSQPAPPSPVSLPSHFRSWYASVERGEAGGSAPRATVASAETQARVQNDEEVARQYEAAFRAERRVRTNSRRAISSTPKDTGKGKAKSSKQDDFDEDVQMKELDREPPRFSPHHRELPAGPPIRRPSPSRGASPAYSAATEVDQEAQGEPGQGLEVDPQAAVSRWTAQQEIHSPSAATTTPSTSELPSRRIRPMVNYPPRHSRGGAPSNTAASHSANPRPPQHLSRATNTTQKPRAKLIFHTVFDEFGNPKMVQAPEDYNLNLLFRKRKARDEETTTELASKRPRLLHPSRRAHFEEPSASEADLESEHELRLEKRSKHDRYTKMLKFRLKRTPRTPAEAYADANELVRELYRARLKAEEAARRRAVQANQPQPPLPVPSVTPISEPSPQPALPTNTTAPRRSRRLQHHSVPHPAPLTLPPVLHAPTAEPLPSAPPTTTIISRRSRRLQNLPPSPTPPLPTRKRRQPQ